jgi:hypothetical protein
VPRPSRRNWKRLEFENHRWCPSFAVDPLTYLGPEPVVVTDSVAEIGTVVAPHVVTARFDRMSAETAVVLENQLTVSFQMVEKISADLYIAAAIVASFVVG